MPRRRVVTRHEAPGTWHPWEAGTPGPANPMASEPTDLDTTQLDQLAKIASEQAGLRDLSDKAKAFRDRAIEVCERVVRDYESRIASLEAHAQALREKARADLAALAVRHEEARLAVQRARVEQQEADFRYEIGEISKADYPDRRKAADERLARAEDAFNAIEAVKRRFTEALKDSGPVPASGPAATAREGPAIPAAEGTQPLAEPPIAAEPSPPGGPAEVPTFLPTPATPQVISAPVPDVMRTHEGSIGPIEAQAPPVETNRPRPAVAGESPTVAIAPAVLREELPGGGEGAAHQLSFVTTIGRTPDNHVTVAEAEVSRHHARITLTEKGFVIEDLKSGNGTLLNGERISGDQLLKDEDRVKIGSRTFVFRMQ